MKGKILRTLGTALIAELNKSGLPREAFSEGSMVALPDDVAQELIARGLFEPTEAKPEKPPTEAKPAK